METHPINLDRDQLRAVESTSPFTLCVASPGSGKSRCVVERIKHLVATGTAPASICVMTFTVAGAAELKKRLDGIRLGSLSTRHSWCFRLLQKYGSTIGYREGGINLIGEEMAEELLQTVAKELGYKKSAKALKEAADPLAQLIHKEFQHRLKRNNLCSYDGVLRDALRLIETAAEIPMPSVLVLDETQDDSIVDWEITMAMQARNPDMTLFAAGDPDQSIFAFRGAYPQGFIDAAARASVVKLETNYRSGSRICAAATDLIRHNTQRIDKATLSAAGAGDGTVQHRHFADDYQERGAISAYIRDQLSVQPPEAFAILCRTNSIAAQFRDSLTAAGIPVRSRERQQLPQDFGFAMDCLSMFADPRSDIIAERVLKRTNPDGIAAGKKLAAEKGLWLSLCTPGLPGNPETLGEPLMRALSRYGCDKETCDLVASRIALLPQPEPTLADLRHDLFDVMKNGLEGGAATGGCFVGTAHSSKGGEWDVVFVVGLEQEDWPGRDSLEEGRRLFFVACTRAKHELYISSSATRLMQWGGIKPRTVSQFVSELGL